MGASLNYDDNGCIDEEDSVDDEDNEDGDYSDNDYSDNDNVLAAEAFSHIF